MKKLTMRRGGVGVMVATLLVSTGLLLQAQLPPAVGSWTVIGSDANARTGAATVTLNDERTLIVGGMLADGTITDTVVVYDPVADVVTPLGQMVAPRIGHTATLLKDGRVLVTGGSTGADASALSADLELLDVSTPALTSSIVGSLPEGRTNHGAARLFDNTVLIVGGSGVDAAPVLTTVLFDPATGALSSAQPLTQARVGASATTLIDGRVLIVGGHNGQVVLDTAEIYDPFLPGPNALVETRLSVARSGHTAVLLPNNNGVLIAGGYSSGAVVKAADLFLPSQFPDPYSWSVGTFAQINDMNVPRDGAAGVPARDGYVRMAGGGSPDAEAYRFATIKTDKDDYAPGELAIITGSGWQPDEIVRLVFQEDPPVHDDYVLEVTADNEGKIYWDQWAPEEHDLNVRFYLTAQGSRSRAQMTFTDGYSVSVSVSAVGSSAMISHGRTNANNACTGISMSSVSVGHGGVQGVGGTLGTGQSIRLSAALTAANGTAFSGWTVAAVSGTAPTGLDLTNPVICIPGQGSASNNNQGILTYTANYAAAASTTLALAPPSPASVSFGSSGPVTLSATLTRTTGSAVSGASVAFTVDGLSVGTAVTNVSGIAAITTYNPAALTAGAHTVQASFAGATISSVVYTASTSGTQSLTVSTAAPTITFGAAPTPTYGSNFTVSASTTNTDSSALTYSVISGPCALVSGSTFSTSGAGTCVVQASGIATANFSASSSTQPVTIAKATATVTVNGYTGIYDGAAHGATGTATGVGGALLTGLVLGDSFTNVPGGTATWIFTDTTGNYNDATGTAAIVINKATATVTVTGYTGVYDAAAHGATGTATGVGGVDLSTGLHFGDSFTNVPGGTAMWTFTDTTGNYLDQSGTAAIVINKATATVTVTGYTGVYDAAAHGATGTATGIGGIALSGLVLGNSFTNVPGGTATWIFTDTTGNYNDATGTAAIVITKANATVAVDGYTGVFDGNAHGATGTATGIGGAALSGLVLGDSFTNVPGGTATWIFTDTTGNYNDATGTVAIIINKADATVSVTGYTGVFDGAAHGATGTATGIGGGALTGLVLGDSFTNVPGGTATWTFTDTTGNYNDSTGTAAIVITKANATVAVDGYTGVFDGNAHGATGTATGIGGGALSGLVLGDSFTNVPGGTATWTFTDTTGNYNDATGTAAIVITKANATVAVDGYTGVFDGNAHGATGTATGIGGGALSGLVLGDSFTNVPGGTATWTFTDTTGNYNDATGTAAIVINKATATVTVTGYTGVYDAAAHGATGTATGVGGVDLSPGLHFGDSFTNVPGGTANWTFTGGTNYLDQSGTAAITINKATATVSVTGYTGVYDAAAHGATGTATGVGGVDLSTGLNFGDSFTNVPGGTASWTFTGGTNYLDQSGTAAITINKATATVTVTGYTGVYDAAAHGATGTATGIGGVALSGLVLGDSFTNVPGGTVTWIFTDTTGNYNDATGTAPIVITKANATVAVDGYTGVFDGNAHGATGTATGIGGGALSGLVLGDSFTNVPGGTATWIFTDTTGNYNDATGTAAIVITKANATVAVNGYTGVFDGVAHGATGTATGVGGVDLSTGLNFGDSFTNVPGGTASWTFTGGTNYLDQNGTAAIIINKATATVSVTGYTGVYDAAAHGATGTATGVGGVDLSTGLNFGDSFTNVPGGTASWTFTGGTNYLDQSGTAAIVINKATATVTVTGYTGVYDAAAHGATGTATGIGGGTLSGLVLGNSFTNVPGGTATWIFTDTTGNYNDATGTAAIVITKANAVIVVTPYQVTYDAAAHTATGTATGVTGEPLAGLNLSATTHTAAGTTSDTWTFTDVTGNYNNASGTVTDKIGKANLTVTAENKTKLLNAANPTLTATYTGFVSGETLATSGATGTPSLTTTAVANSPVGTYPIAAAMGTLVAANYEFTFANGTLKVLYDWDGFLQPINDTAHDVVTMSKFKTGQTIPAKFDLKDVNGNIVQQTVSPTFNYAPIGACGAASLDTIEAVYQASTLPIYTLNGGHYQYNWSTKGVSSGLYRIFAKLNDGTTQFVDICLSK